MPPEPDEKERINLVSVELMARIKEGDDDAFQMLVELHQSAVVGTVAKMLGNIEDAHDVAQQVFLRIWKSAPRYQPTAKFTTWLFTITRNLVFNETRKRSRRCEVSLESEAEDSFHADTPDPNAPIPDTEVLQGELEKAIDRAIQALPENQRLAVVLRRYEDLSYEDIAKTMDLSVPAVKSLLFRARGQLRGHLTEYLEH